MATYNLNIDTVNTSLTYFQAEKYIYGSSRLGMLKDSVNVLGSAFGNTDSSNIIHTLGNKRYELSNHLGNVLTTISDKPIPHQNGSNVDYWLADIKTAQDYSAFGVQLDGRSFGDTSYSRGFQGQEQDRETGLVNYTYRMHNPRLGRFFAVDPLSAKYPYNSSYAFSENRVIDGIELEGLEWKETDDKGNLKIYSVISIVTEGEGAIHNSDEIAEYIEAAQIQYNLNPQNISSLSNIFSGKSNEKSTFTTFNFNISDIGEFSDSKTVSNYDENDKRFFLGTAIRMGKPEDFEKEEDGVMASYRGEVIGILLNPKYFDPNGDGYKTTTKGQRINALVHEIGHDFDLNHCGPDGKQSNKREDYPKNGFMALSGDKINKMTDEELNEIQNTDKIQNKE